ncbi:MAG: DUF2096 family protein [Candidatus Bathyarchaeota archaeon]
MGYLEVWKVLEDIIVDFRKKEITIPKNIMADLRHVKTLINVLQADPDCLDTRKKVEDRLHEVESYLVSEAQIKFGSKYVEALLVKLDIAIKKTGDKDEQETRFVSGLPRKHRWIRVRISAELPIKHLKSIIENLGLSYRETDGESLLVYGADQQIKELITKMKEDYKKAQKKQ